VRFASRLLVLLLPVLGWLLFVRSPGLGDPQAHFLAETVAVGLALEVAAIALLRYYSRRSDRFLLLGTAFLGTAFLDAFHVFVNSAWFARRFPAPQLSSSPWSWLASRIFLASFLCLACRTGEREKPLGELKVYVTVGLVALACFLFFLLLPLPHAYFPDLVLARPAELLPALILGCGLALCLRRGSWRRSDFEQWLIVSLAVGILGQVAFMAFSRRPYDAANLAAHLAKDASYLAVLIGLLGSMYSLFRRADVSATELGRINAALQGEMQERERVEHDRDRFFSLSLDMLCISDMDGYFQQLNPAWEKTLGFSLEELTARPFLDFVHPDDQELTVREASKLRLGGVTVDFENRYRTRDGSYRWLSWRAVGVPDLGLIYSMARDIDERKKVEQMKTDFVSVVSHELRTPLTSIRGSLGLLAGGVAGQLPEKVRPLVEIASKNSDRLVRLINDILDIEKIESGQMGFRFVPLELMPLIEQGIEANRAYAQPFGVEMHVSGELPGVRVWADADRLLQVLANLLSNAIKFSPPNGVVEVSVTRQGDRLRVAVTDHGRGVPAEFQPRIFEKFAQADASSTRQKGGTGLGLSISKAIVERHGGAIGFYSVPGEATTFFFDLPDWRARAEPPPSERSAKGCVLICEDDPDVARLLGLMLAQEGYDTDLAYDAAEAKRLMGLRRYDAMTLDLMLPGQDGVSLIRELRGHDDALQLPIVVVSARAQEGKIELDGGALGVIDWLGKPIDERRLSDALHHAIRGGAGHARILHVEDDADLQRVVAAIVAAEAKVESARDLAQARERLAAERYDLVILDLALPDGSGLDLLPLLGSVEPPTPVIVFSAHEVDEQTSGRVASVLVKSRTSNPQLLERIRVVLEGRG
jgi:PAS domain S-box-containing protein